ncbi:lysosome-associated membrane glycoprotein 2 isoform X1 [Bufo gargarizans]|uniref:lysosome-associated membrane glycoprotein 2 isoform X1 n=1 Tax=Bufo gargarizans TaxID=30331 RepID=UPI001CF33A34|nr:lysosome-associated membrane glycoprotein 2 isoform X1 [Bufo gargarizans]
MERYLRGVLMCLLGLGLMTEAFEVEIKNGSNTCIYASMNVNFTIQYETNSSKSINATLVVPDKVTTDGSTCGGKEVAPLLVVNFGSNHSLRLNFTSDGTVYRVDVIVFTYNTNDSEHFQDAKTKGLFSTFKSVDIAIPVNATYVCLNEAVVVTENVVQVYQNVSLLAFSQDKPFTKEFHCSADASTTQAPVTPNITTPNTPSTTPTPTTKPVDNPTIGNYTVLNGTETCLLASMGLQLNATLLVDGKTVWTPLNIDPKNTNSSGSCGNDSALLRLNDNGTIVEFLFLVKNKNFYLQEVNVTLVNASGMSVRTNSNLSLWEASLGSSYLCHKEQTITVSDDLYVNTFDVRVQPFGVKNATYATAEDCLADSDLSFLIPVVVGAVLAFLIILVFISYLIGRRKSRTGYQSV